MGQAKQRKTEIEQLKTTNKLFRNTPSKLQPFYWDSDSYFTDFIKDGIEGKIKTIQSTANAISLRTSYVKSSYERMNEDGQLGNYTQQEHESYAGRMARHTARDLKKFAELLTAHLEQIEVTGEWK